MKADTRIYVLYSTLLYSTLHDLARIYYSPQNEEQYTLHLSTLQCTAVQCSAVQCSAVQFSAVQCSAIQCSAVQCSIVPCSVSQCFAVQCSSVQYSRVAYSVVGHISRRRGNENTSSELLTNAPILHYTAQGPSLHCTALCNHCTALCNHCTALHCALHCTALHCTVHWYITIRVV